MCTTTTAASPSSHDGSIVRLSKDAQWDIISSKLDTLSLSTAATPRWLELVDESIMLTVIAKIRSELELLQAEAESMEIQPSHSAVKYNAEMCKPIHPLPAPGPSLPMPISRPPLMSRRSRNNAESSTGCLGMIQTKTPLRREHSDGDQYSRPHEVSPLSPTFGPRKGLVLSGTVDRRRSIPRYSPTTDQHTLIEAGYRSVSPHSAPLMNTRRSTPITNFHKILESRSMGFEEKKMIWEAAWAEIERSLPTYAERFEESRSVSTKPKKEEIWTELITLLGDRRALCRRNSQP